MTTAQKYFYDLACEAVQSPVIRELFQPVLREIVKEELENAKLKGGIVVPDQHESFNVQQAAEFTGRKPATIYGLVYEKRIPFYKPDGRLVFFRSELIEWMKGNYKSSNNDVDEQARQIIVKRNNRRKNTQQRGGRSVL